MSSMRTTSKPSLWMRLLRRQIRPKGMEKAFRRWRMLGSTWQSTGATPDGDDMVYRMNATTLEIGQGINGMKGVLGTVALMGVGAMGYAMPGVLTDLFTFSQWPDYVEDMGWFMAVLYLLTLLLLIPLFVMCLGVFIGAFFGYTDSLIRFDRIRRKVWVFIGGREPMELDWDQLTPVIQSVTPANATINTFYTARLVDLDAEGEVKMQGWHPHMVQIGPLAVVDAGALAQYEFVRQFMQDGPLGLQCKRYLQHRKTLREVFNPMSLLDLMRQSDFGLGHILVLFVVYGAFGPFLLVFSLADYIASYVNRIPRWPDRIEACAAEGGELRPPPNAQPQCPPIVAKELPFIVMGLISASLFYGWAFYPLMR